MIYATDDNVISPFNRLPDEIVFEILNKSIDLKTLCISKLVSKRFYSIIHQVDTISFTAPSGLLKRTPCESFTSALNSMKMFSCLKFLCIVLPISDHQKHADVDDRCLFKWKINIGKRVERRQAVQVEVDLLTMKRCQVMCNCMYNAISRFRILLTCMICLPLVEKVSIKDFGKKGRVSLDGGKIADLRNFIHSNDDKSIERRLTRNIKRPRRLIWSYHPWFELRVSRYILRGVTIIKWQRDDHPDGDDTFMDLEDTE